MGDYIKEIDNVLLMVNLMDESKFYALLVAFVVVFFLWRLPSIMNAFRGSEGGGSNDDG